MADSRQDFIPDNDNTNTPHPAIEMQEVGKIPHSMPIEIYPIEPAPQQDNAEKPDCQTAAITTITTANDTVTSVPEQEVKEAPLVESNKPTNKPSPPVKEVKFVPEAKILPPETSSNPSALYGNTASRKMAGDKKEEKKTKKSRCQIV